MSADPAEPVDLTHEGFTRMLFVDAIVGVGFPHYRIGADAVRGGLARFIGGQHDETWAWERAALEELDVSTLQELYTGLKMYEVTHAS